MSARTPRPEGRLFVILMDDGLIPFEPAAINHAKSPLSLSAVAPSPPAAPSAIPKDHLATPLPIVPTTVREFGRTDNGVRTSTSMPRR